jgi:hypothetical protein
MSDKSSEAKIMSAIAEASHLVRQIAEPCPAGDSVKAAMLRACRRVGSLSFNRVKDIWYADRRVSVSGDELNHLRAIARAKEEAVARDEYQSVIGRIARLEAALRLADEEFTREEIASLQRKDCASIDDDSPLD